MNLSLYSYAANNPVKYIDPNGKLWWFAPLVIGGTYVGVNMPSKEEHYARNEHNVGMPLTLADAKDSNSIRRLPDSKAIFHRQGVDANGKSNTDNQKFVSTDGLREVVYDSDTGALITDDVNQGTYNFKSPDDVIGHAIEDVLPYYLYGNSEDDPTRLSERLTGSYKGDVSITKEQRIQNEQGMQHEQDAQVGTIYGP